MPPSDKPLSDTSLGKSGTGCAVLFCLIFVAAGLGFLWPIALQPIAKVLAARTWVPVPSYVVHSHVDTNEDSDGDTYKAVVHFRYVWEGRTFDSTGHSFFDMYSSGYGDKAEVVEKFSTGSEHVAYVNPRDPSEAVLERQLTGDLLWGLIPLVFVLLGLLGCYAILRQARKGRGTLSTNEGAVPLPDGTFLLRPTAGTRHRRAAAFGAAIFWNAITAVPLVIFIREASRGKVEWVLLIVLIPFVLVGLALLWACMRELLASGNPKVRLIAPTAVVPLDGDIRLQWEVTRSSRTLRALQLTLEGTEEATYRRGTDTTVDRSVFARTLLLNATEPAALQGGTISTPVPPGAMHSFDGGNNKITWKLRVEGKVANCPDIKEEYAIVISPAGGGA